MGEEYYKYYVISMFSDEKKHKEIYDFIRKDKVHKETIFMIDVTSKDGFEDAEKNCILKLPMLVLFNLNNNPIDRFYTLKEIKKHFIHKRVIDCMTNNNE